MSFLASSTRIRARSVRGRSPRSARVALAGVSEVGAPPAMDSRSNACKRLIARVLLCDRLTRRSSRSASESASPGSAATLGAAARATALTPYRYRIQRRRFGVTARSPKPPQKARSTYSLIVLAEAKTALRAGVKRSMKTCRGMAATGSAART